MTTYDLCKEQYGQILLALQSSFHMEPELSFHEEKTTASILRVLSDIGIEIVDIGAKTGCVGVLRAAAKKGPSVALRADIDAIPQHEKTGRNDASTIDGIMHGCGHDTHLTSLLGAAMFLYDHRDLLTNDVYVVFQPAEETLSGARYLIEECELFTHIHPDMMFGLHNDPELPIGTAACGDGIQMAYKDAFRVLLTGRSGHSSMPQNNIDPVVCAAALISSAQTIISRNVGPLEAAVLSICHLRAGSDDNLITDDAELTGNIRTLDPDVRERVLAHFKTICEHTAAAYGCDMHCDVSPIVPGVFNSDALRKTADRAIKKALGEDAKRDPVMHLASEDYSLYGKYVPSVFYFLGSGMKDHPVHTWHSAQFHPDPETPVYGAALLAESVLCAQDMSGYPDDPVA